MFIKFLILDFDQVNSSSLTINSNNNLSSNQQNNKLPLFDQFSVQLRSSPLPNSIIKQIKLSKTESLDEIF